MVHLALPWLRLVACPPRDGRQTSPYSQLGGSCTGEIAQSRSLFLGAWKSVPLLLAPAPPGRPRCISCRPGVSILAPTGQEPQQPVCKPPPTLHLFRTLVIAAYLPSCHRWAHGTPMSRTRPGTTFPSGPGVTRWSASLQVPACPSQSWASGWVSPPL